MHLAGKVIRIRIRTRYFGYILKSIFEAMYKTCNMIRQWKFTRPLIPYIDMEKSGIFRFDLRNPAIKIV